MTINASLKATSCVFLLSVTSCAWDQLDPDFDCSISPIQLEILESNKTECNTASGAFAIGVSGGESPYTFSSEAGVSSDGSFDGLTAGTYVVEVADVNGCSEEISVDIQNLNGVNLDEVLTTNTGCQTSDGSVEIEASGGTEPYLYSINGSDDQVSNTFSGLPGGTHTINIKDQEGCEITTSVKLTSGVEFSTIEGIIKNRCLGCHGSNGSPSFSSYEQISDHADRIKVRTSEGTMPPDSSIPQSEIDAISCWVNDGALSN